MLEKVQAQLNEFCRKTYIVNLTMNHLVQDARVEKKNFFHNIVNGLAPKHFFDFISSNNNTYCSRSQELKNSKTLFFPYCVKELY